MAANTITRVSLYKRYVDDIIIFCASKDEAKVVYNYFNGLYSKISFTLELGSQSSTSFLDAVMVPFKGVLVAKTYGKDNTVISKALPQSPISVH